MDRYRQRTIAELLKKTSKLNRPRMTPILEGKDRMQGPLDITDPDMDFASLQVCGNCRNHLDVSIAQNCGICNRGHHSFCLEAPPNEAEDRSVQCCYDCQHQPALDNNQPGSSSKDSHSRLLEDRMDVCKSSENVPDCEEPPGTSYDVSEHSPVTKKMDLSWNEASPSNQIADSGGTIFDTLYKPTKTRAARKLGIRRKRVTDTSGFDSSSGQVLPSEIDTLMPVQESSGMDVMQIASKVTLEVGGVMSTCLETGSEESKDSDRTASSIPNLQINNARMRSDLEEANVNQPLEVHVVSPNKDAEYTMEDIATGDELVKEGNVTGAEKLMGSPKLDVALTVQPVSRNSCMPSEDHPTDVSATSEAPSVEIQEEMTLVGSLDSRDLAKEEHFPKKTWNAAPQMVVEQEIVGERQILIVSQVNSVDQLPKLDDDAHGVSAMALAADLPPLNTTGQGTCSPTTHRAPSVDAYQNKSSFSSVLEGQSEDDMSKPSVFVDMKRTLPCIQEEIVEHLSDGLIKAPHKENPSSKAHMDIDSTFTGSEATHASSLSSPNSRVAMEDDIKVCDLCGDAGYEDMLAICSECNGAEHVYCYQNLMAQVPEGYWQCDVCKLKQKAGDFRPSTDIRSVNSLPMRLPSFNRKHSNVGNSRSRLSALLQKRRLPSEKKRAMKGIPSSQFPAKRGLPGVDAPPTKKQAVEASSPPYMASAASSKLGLIKEASFKIPDTGKVKFVSHTALMGSTGEGTGLSSRGSGKLSLSVGSASSIPLNSSTVGQMSKGRFLSATNSILGPGSAKVNTNSQLNMPSSSVSLVNSGSKPSGVLKSTESVPPFLHTPKSMGSKLQLSIKGSKETSDSLGLQSLPKEGLLGQSSISNARVLNKTGSFKLSKVISMGGAQELKLKHDVNLDSAKSSGSRSVHPEVGLVKGAENKYEAVMNSGLPEIKSKAVVATESQPPFETHNGVDKLVKHELAGGLGVTNSPSKDEPMLVASGTSETQQSSVLGSSVKDVQDLSIDQERKFPFQVTSPHSLAKQTPKLPEQVGPDTLKEVSKTNMDVIQSPPLLPRPVILIQGSSSFKEENKQLQLAVSVDVAGEKNTLAVVDKAPTHDDNRSSFTPRSRTFGAWGSPSYVPSLGSTRCYRCKELGHSAKNCNNRSSMPCVSSEATGALKPVLPASNVDTHVDSTCVLKGVVPASMDNATRNVQSNVEAIPKIKPITEMASIIKPSSTERGVVFAQNLNSLVQLQVEEGQVVEDVTPSLSPFLDQVMRNDTLVSKQVADSVLSPPQVNVVGTHHTDDAKETADGKKEDDNTSVRLVSSTVVSVPSGAQLITSSAEWQPPVLSIPSTTRSAVHLSAALGPLSSANVKVTSPFVSRYQESLKVYPEAQIVWQGAFEVAGKSKPQVSFHGLQANPSNRALPKVREVAKKLQPLLPLEELPRGSEHNSWPVQFQKSPPINDNIALYFFASGKESYVQYYKPLVDRLIKFDLTLKGFIEDAELLIFPSNLLPPGSQCWNNFMFLWAVFRARKPPIKQPNIHFTASESKQAGNDSGLKLPLQSGVLTWGKVEDMQIDTIANKNIDIPHAAGNKVETPSLTIAESANTVGPCALFDSDVVCEQPPPCQQESQHLMQVEAAMKEGQKAQAEPILSQPEKAVATVLPSTQDSIVVKSQPLSHVLLPTEGGLNLNASNESSQKFNSSIKLEEKVDANVKLVVPSAPKVSSALLRSEHGSTEKAKHSTPLMGTSPALLASPSPRDRQEDVWTPRKLSSHSPAGQQDKDKGVRERVNEKSDRMESGRGVSRDRDREKIRDREKHKERDRDRERSRRHSDWEREKERDRGKERERDRDRDRDRDRGRERERDRERWRDREERDRRGRDWDRDREKVGERDKGRERGREREAERERALGRDRSRHRNWDPAEADYGRSGRHWHRYPRSRTPSRSPPGNRDSSPSRPRLDRYHHRYQRSFRHSRSYSHSPDSDHGLARLQPRAESRDLSKDSFAPKGKSPDIVAGDSRAKEESAVKNSAVKDSGGDEQGNYSQRGSNSNSLCRENTAGKERKLPIADLNLSPSEIEGNEEEGNDDDVMMSVEVAMPLTANQDDDTSGCHDFLPVDGHGEEPGECSISAGKMITNQSTEHLMCVDERTDSRSHSLMNDSSGRSYIPISVSLEGSSSCLHFFPQPMDDDNRVPSIPDLSLALGAKERSPPQPAELPLFMQLLEPCQESSRVGSFNPSLDVPMISEQADLSLSLAIPEHSKRPVVNTSLRLFG